MMPPWPMVRHCHAGRHEDVLRAWRPLLAAAIIHACVTATTRRCMAGVVRWSSPRGRTRWRGARRRWNAPSPGPPLSRSSTRRAWPLGRVTPRGRQCCARRAWRCVETGALRQAAWKACRGWPHWPSLWPRCAARLCGRRPYVERSGRPCGRVRVWSTSAVAAGLGAIGETASSVSWVEGVALSLEQALRCALKKSPARPVRLDLSSGSQQTRNRVRLSSG